MRRTEETGIECYELECILTVFEEPEALVRTKKDKPILGFGPRGFAELQ